MKLLLTTLISGWIFAAPPSYLLSCAEKGYDYAKTKNMIEGNIVVLVDFSKPSNQKRLWLYDMEHHKTILESYVAHGKGSGINIANKFSNKSNSKMSSIGFFQISNTYNGKHGLSIKLNGLEPENISAMKRGIVIHAANYAEDQYIKDHNRAGRSWGCFAVSKKTEKEIIAKIQNHSLLLAYYPNSEWINHSNFIHNSNKTEA